MNSNSFGCSLYPPAPARSAESSGRSACGFQIDDELELRRLLHGEIGGLSAFQNLVHIGGGAPVQVGKAHAVGHKPPGFHKFCPVVYRREPALYREVCNLCSLRSEDGARQHEGLRQHAPCLRLGMQSQYPWDLVRLGIEASPRTPLRRVPISLNACALPGLVEVPKTATRESLGTISFRSSSCFPLSSGARVDNPVMFPPVAQGWRRTRFQQDRYPAS